MNQPLIKKEEPCKVCGKVKYRSAMIAHAARKHPVELMLWKDGRASFGMAILDHVYPSRMERAALRA